MKRSLVQWEGPRFHGEQPLDPSLFNQMALLFLRVSLCPYFMGSPLVRHM